MSHTSSSESDTDTTTSSEESSESISSSDDESSSKSTDSNSESSSTSTSKKDVQSKNVTVKQESKPSNSKKTSESESSQSSTSSPPKAKKEDKPEKKEDKKEKKEDKKEKKEDKKEEKKEEKKEKKEDKPEKKDKKEEKKEKKEDKKEKKEDKKEEKKEKKEDKKEKKEDKPEKKEKKEDKKEDKKEEKKENKKEDKKEDKKEKKEDKPEKKEDKKEKKEDKPEKKEDKPEKKEDKKEKKEDKKEKKEDKPEKKEDKPEKKEEHEDDQKDHGKEEKDKKKLDRYGWFVEKRKMSPREKQLIKIEESKEFERSLKWVEMTDNKHWNQWMKNKRNKVASRVKKGIPDSIRSRAWALLTETSKMKKKYPTTMNELLEKPAHDGYIVINKDLSRTFPQIGFFSKPGFIESLRRVLCCYCQTDPTLGYTQGMSFIAGMLLAYMDEETAYYSFVNIMLQPRINHRGYLLSGFPRLERANDMLLCLMDKKCPKVIKRMNEIGVFMQMFTPGWFLTAYQSFNWPPEFQLRIFERFLFYGTRALINFAIIIIMKHVDILEKAEIEVFLKVLQHPDESERMMNWHSVLEDWDKNWIKKKEYEYLLDRVGAQSETDHY